MSNKSVDIATMLDDLNLPLAALRWKEIVAAPELADFTPYQLFREVLEPQYLETMNNLQNVTVTGQQGHNSRPAKDTMPGQMLS